MDEWLLTIPADAKEYAMHIRGEDNDLTREMRLKALRAKGCTVFFHHSGKDFDGTPLHRTSGLVVKLPEGRGEVTLPNPMFRPGDTVRIVNPEKFTPFKVR